MRENHERWREQELRSLAAPSVGFAALFSDKRRASERLVIVAWLSLQLQLHRRVGLQRGGVL